MPPRDPFGDLAQRFSILPQALAAPPDSNFELATLNEGV